ncbi:galactoside 2-alpha-L-fucosyltransferase SEC1-like isoform X2 [Schistocerca gregaria]|uniref:galactoside 2-alpha-L-fucosyltransferase SEC1-like isoform X2 n=1 Tax=Schistocerca gregaria TaxID=7010 RepID=UPI00211DEB5D|nr:galactoside 2-alpha-L-fucosyltransferase SEC1-like isoform X2 [Schistocerca gregaria]
MCDLCKGRRRPRPVGLRWALVTSAALLVCLCVHRTWYTRSVFWEDDVAAASAPFTYRFSSNNHPFPGVALSEVSVKCLPRGAVTVRSGGRLGNLIMEFLSLWTAARLHNLTAFVPSQLRDRLHEVFEPLGVPDTVEFLSQSGCPEDAMEEAHRRLFKVDLETVSLAEVVARAKELHVPIVFEMWIILPETIIPLAADVRRRFRYRPKLREYAENKLRSLRRTVLEANPNVKVVPSGGELVLVVTSDDPYWVQDVLLPHLRSLGLRHTFLMGDGLLDEPEWDLALLSACNHSVLAYGTFGLLSALMTGGRAAVYHLQRGDAVSPAMQFAQHITGWVAISQ